MQSEFIVDFGGILLECFDKVRSNFYEKIDENIHANTYVGEHDLYYAEPEFTGKFMDICAYYYETERDERAYNKGMTVALSVYNNQREDGYFGGLSEGNELNAFSVWNQGFTLYGLTRMYEVTKDERVKEAMLKGVDWLVEIFSRPKANIFNAPNDGSQHISCIYAIMKVYLLTENEKYIDFVKTMLEFGETTDMNLLSFSSIFDLRSKKGIEMLVIYLGVLQYGLITADSAAINAAKRYWQEIFETQIRNTGNGTIKEVWEQNGNAAKILPTEIKPNETCVAVGWCELSLKLFYYEQKKEYLDAVEKTLFNHLIGSLAKNGSDVAYYQGNCGKKMYRTDDGAYQCCRYRGFTFFSYIKEFLYYYDGKTIIPMLYGPSAYENKDFKIVQTTNYPAEGKIAFDITSDSENRMLKLRVPYWCSNYNVLKNSEVLNTTVIDGYISVKIPKGQTRVVVCFEMSLISNRDLIDNEAYLSFNYGPLLLTLDTCFGNQIDDTAKLGGEHKLLSAKGQLIHIGYDNLHLVDYASAGSTNPDQDQYTVFIKEG